MMYLLRAFVARLFYCLLVSTALRFVTRTGCAVIVLCALVLGFSASNARAGVFKVAACQADQLNFSSRAFTHWATRRMMIKRACNPEGPGLRGLVTANVVHAGRVKRGSISKVTIQAPPGTWMTKLDWAGGVRRRDCRYGLHLYATAPGIKNKFTLKNVPANKFCPKPGRAQAAWVVQPFPLPNATEIVQQVVCVGTKRRPWCSARELNYIRTYAATVESSTICRRQSRSCQTRRSPPGHG